MARILCLDTEPETEHAIRSDGHIVDCGSMGYRTGIYDQPHDPRAYDMVVCDLRQPVCYNGEAAESAPSTPPRLVQAPPEGYRRIAGRLIPTFRLVRRSDIADGGKRRFSGADVLDAVRDADTLVVLFLNTQWIRHLDTEFPDWLALAWRFQRTVARGLVVEAAMKSALPEVGSLVHLATPLRDQIVAGPTARQIAEISWDLSGLSAFEDRKLDLRVSALVGSRTGQVFGQAIRPGDGPGARLGARLGDRPGGTRSGAYGGRRGAILALPPFDDNATAARLLAARLDSILERHPDY